MKLRNTRTIRTLFAILAIVATAALAPIPAAGQGAFPSPEAAADTLVAALEKDDPQALQAILGENWEYFIPTDDVDREDVDAFLAAWQTAHKLVAGADGGVHLVVGANEWSLPIPIVKSGDVWDFDVQAGAEEIRTRRIGNNELSAMQAALAYCDAQKEFALADRNDDGVLEYARRLVSSPGTRDGLYWEAKPGSEQSPLGPLFGDDQPGTDYHGYYFRILKAQGKHAPGGAYDYRIKGRLMSGFALAAWPVAYGDSGVMTFVVNHKGQIYEKNLGPQTDSTARGMQVFDPDSSWRKVSP
ncbi:MAG: DUF2950 domain-containing protein [Desulfobacterales bacterium]|nr:DUF2950 domain-containing protein [Desulfobacterales bacterium]